MKKLFVVSMMATVIAGLASSAFARSGVEGDLFASVATESADFGGDTIGGGIGVSVPLTLLFPVKMGGHEENVMLRTDISYYKWTDDLAVPGGYFVDASYRRIPVFVGARYFHALSDRFRVFGETGLEVSFDRLETDYYWGPNPAWWWGLPYSTSKSEVNVGLGVGAGVEFSFGPGFFVGGNLRAHVVSDSYASLNTFIGKRF